MQITIFLDYDNLSEGQKRAGILDTITQALFLEGLDTSDNSATCAVRIYGGWYQGSTFTTRAQDLTREIQDSFPTIVRCSTRRNQICLVRIRAELALSLAEDPTYHLWDTFRKKQVSNSIRVQSPASSGCTLSPCKLEFLPKLFKKQKCPEISCQLPLGNFAFRNEQKLVDTMLTCDVLHAADQRCDLLIIISDDDDVIPAARSATLRNVSVLRVHPKPRLHMTKFPAGLGVGRYSERVL